MGWIFLIVLVVTAGVIVALIVWTDHLDAQAAIREAKRQCHRCESRRGR